jgi:acyl-CoA synthetase (NDP forming)
VAIVSNSGGPGILATDACDGAGLEVSELTAETQAALREIVDPNGAVANPVDLVASATPDVYRQVLRIVLADERVDAVIVICTPTFAAPPARVAAMLPAVAGGVDEPVVGCFLAAPELPPLLHDDNAGAIDGSAVPVFASPEPAARALARAATYAGWRRRPPGAVPELAGFDADRAREVVERFLAGTPRVAGCRPTRSTGCSGPSACRSCAPSPSTAPPMLNGSPRSSATRWCSRPAGPTSSTRATWAVCRSTWTPTPTWPPPTTTWRPVWESA